MRGSTVPLRTRFRGIDVRDGVLVRGSGRLGRVLPVLGLRRRGEPALGAAALERPPSGWPDPVRTRPGQRHRAGRRPRAGARDRHALRLPDGEGEGRRAGQSAADDLARVEAVRDALGPAGRSASTRTPPGTSTPRSPGSPSSTASGSGVRRAAVRHRSRSSSRCAAGSTSGWPPTRWSGGPPTRCGSTCAKPATSSSSRCSRWAASGPRCGSPRRTACRASSPRRWSPPSASRPGWRWPRAARAAVRLRPGHRRAVHRRRLSDAAAAGRRRAAGPAPPGAPDLLEAHAQRDTERVAWWHRRLARVAECAVASIPR